MNEDWRDDVEPCYYCGLAAIEVDHVIPRSVLEMIDSLGDWKLAKKIRGNRTLKVPSCHECNTLLGASCQETLRERKRFLKKKLRKKYKKILKMPQWTEAELAEMGPSLQQHIRGSIAQKEIILSRLRW